MLQGLCIPLRTTVRGYSQAEADSLSVSERRQRTSIRVGYVARTVYLGLQLACIVMLLQSDSQLGKSWQAQHATYAWSFLVLAVLSLLLYIAVCTSNPGYLPVRGTDAESAPVMGTTAQPTDLDSITESAVPGHSTGYGPLPYPTNYANYINLEALGQNTANRSGEVLPWWDQPNPGRPSQVLQSTCCLPSSVFSCASSTPSLRART